ncbi:MAG: hypothetical protein C5B49_14575 [Bdellovibrio sp.]|nr:MAG: hypothetical protein C5B49_14575 [Bdellovibrio sp.]
MSRAIKSIKSTKAAAAIIKPAAAIRLILSFLLSFVFTFDLPAQQVLVNGPSTNALTVLERAKPPEPGRCTMQGFADTASGLADFIACQHGEQNRCSTPVDKVHYAWRHRWSLGLRGAEMLVTGGGAFREYMVNWPLRRLANQIFRYQEETASEIQRGYAKALAAEWKNDPKAKQQAALKEFLDDQKTFEKIGSVQYRKTHFDSRGNATDFEMVDDPKQSDLAGLFEAKPNPEKPIRAKFLTVFEQQDGRMVTKTAVIDLATEDYYSLPQKARDLSRNMRAVYEGVVAEPEIVNDLVSGNEQRVERAELKMAELAHKAWFDSERARLVEIYVKGILPTNPQALEEFNRRFEAKFNYKLTAAKIEEDPPGPIKRWLYRQKAPVELASSLVRDDDLQKYVRPSFNPKLINFEEVMKDPELLGRDIRINEGVAAALKELGPTSFSNAKNLKMHLGVINRRALYALGRVYGAVDVGISVAATVGFILLLSNLYSNRVEAAALAHNAFYNLPMMQFWESDKSHPENFSLVRGAKYMVDTFFPDGKCVGKRDGQYIGMLCGCNRDNYQEFESGKACALYLNYHPYNGDTGFCLPRTDMPSPREFEITINGVFNNPTLLDSCPSICESWESTAEESFRGMETVEKWAVEKFHADCDRSSSKEIVAVHENGKRTWHAKFGADGKVAEISEKVFEDPPASATTTIVYRENERGLYNVSHAREIPALENTPAIDQPLVAVPNLGLVSDQLQTQMMPAARFAELLTSDNATYSQSAAKQINDPLRFAVMKATTEALLANLPETCPFASVR